MYIYTGLLSKQGEKSIDFYFIMVPLRKKSIEVWYSKAQYTYIYIYIYIYTQICVSVLVLNTWCAPRMSLDSHPALQIVSVCLSAAQCPSPAE